MAKQSALTEQERADLVAYLDGELEGAAARSLEAKLTLDPAARAEADALKRTWDLLDYLPRAEPSPSFTYRTLERLTPVPAGRRFGPGRRWRPWALGMGWAAAVLAACVGGYAGMRLVRPRGPDGPDPRQQDQELVRDLRVIENKRLYEAVEDVEFLEKLDRPDLFGDDNADS